MRGALHTPARSPPQGRPGRARGADNDQCATYMLINAPNHEIGYCIFLASPSALPACSSASWRRASDSNTEPCCADSLILAPGKNDRKLSATALRRFSTSAVGIEAWAKGVCVCFTCVHAELACTCFSKGPTWLGLPQIKIFQVPIPRHDLEPCGRVVGQHTVVSSHTSRPANSYDSLQKSHHQHAPTHSAMSDTVIT